MKVVKDDDVRNGLFEVLTALSNVAKVTTQLLT